MSGRTKLVREYTDRQEAIAECAWCVRQYGKRFSVGLKPDGRYIVGRPGDLSDMGLETVYSKRPPSNRSVRRTKEEQLEVVRHWRSTGNVVKTAAHFNCATSTVYAILSRYGSKHA